MDPLMLPWLTPAALVGAALVGGVFFGFSTFVMRALGRLPAPQGIAAMQAINVTAINPLFMLALFGTGVACLVLGVAGFRAAAGSGTPWQLAGCALYLAGVVVVTIAFNVPRNDALARVEPTSAEGARLWESYLRVWTAWNHVRTVSGLGAAVLLGLG